MKFQKFGLKTLREPKAEGDFEIMGWDRRGHLLNKSLNSWALSALHGMMMNETLSRSSDGR